VSTPDLDLRFTHHPPPDLDTARRHREVRTAVHDCARALDTLLPDSREKSLVLTKLEEALMWANAAIAREPARAKAGALEQAKASHPSSRPGPRPAGS
jgi:hypothetical protein